MAVHSDSIKNVLQDITNHLNSNHAFTTKKQLPETSVKFASNIKTSPMNTQEFSLRGKEMVDYIVHYLETIHSRRVTPNVEPGYLKSYLPESAPIKAESWDTIMDDFEKYIMPGVTHWQHPRFHAYFPAGNCFPSILADMISDAIGCVGFSWVRL